MQNPGPPYTFQLTLLGFLTSHWASQPLKQQQKLSHSISRGSLDFSHHPRPSSSSWCEKMWKDSSKNDKMLYTETWLSLGSSLRNGLGTLLWKQVLQYFRNRYSQHKHWHIYKLRNVMIDTMEWIKGHMIVSLVRLAVWGQVREGYNQHIPKDPQAV